MFGPLGYGVPSPAPETSRIIKNAPGKLLSINVNSGAAAGWLMLIDAATVPAAGGAAVAPVWWAQIPINTTFNYNWELSPLIFVNGIVAIFSTTGPFTYTASNTATFSAQAF